MRGREVEMTQCEACNILIGERHLETSLVLFRGHWICYTCVSYWERLDALFLKRIKRKTTWEEFKNPALILKGKK